MIREKTVDNYINNSELWDLELKALREILLEVQLEECIKWGAPCYMLNGQNLVGMNGFKSYFGLWFYQGALLKDMAGVLINAQDGKTTAMRQWRMTSAQDINPELIRQYLGETIAHCKAGKKVKMPAKKPLVIPQDLNAALSKDKAGKEKFAAMSLSCRREYADYISEAKQDATKHRRLAKILPMIKAGGGLHDKYKP